MKVGIFPHTDDEALFSSFTLLRERPLVVIVFDGHVQRLRGEPITAEQRREETNAACSILGVDVEFLGFSDANPPDAATLAKALAPYAPYPAYVPAVEEDGHKQHNLVGTVAKAVLDVEREYMTYTRHGKSTGERVPFEPDWPRKKLLALACYESQIRLANTAEHFLRNQFEYYRPRVQ
jgi:LmbE family N-acetylglucosaminyl deacetylase